jgi:hypothetical protein
VGECQQRDGDAPAHRDQTIEFSSVENIALDGYTQCPPLDLSAFP